MEKSSSSIKEYIRFGIWVTFVSAILVANVAYAHIIGFAKEWINKPYE